MTLAELIAELLDIVHEGPPSAVAIEERLAGRATARNAAADGVYLALGGDVTGVHVREDSRGWGAYADLVVRDGTLADIESVVGPTSPMPRNPDDFTSGERVAAYVDRSGWTVRVFIELARDAQQVRHVTISYPSRATPARAPGPAPVVVAPLLRSELLPHRRRRPPATGDARTAERRQAHTGAFCRLLWVLPRVAGEVGGRHAMPIDRVFVAGAGFMGHGIAQVHAAVGKYGRALRTRPRARRGRAWTGSATTSRGPWRRAASPSPDRDATLARITADGRLAAWPTPIS